MGLHWWYTDWINYSIKAPGGRFSKTEEKMIWIILILTWAIVTVITWKFTKVWAILAAITLILSFALYYFLGHPNLPDHPHKEIAKVLKK